MLEPQTLDDVKTLEGELLARAEAALESALRLGADGARVSLERGRSAEFRGFEGRTEKAQESHGQELSVALFVDGRFSTHATNDLEPARLERFLEQAIALTRQLEVDPYRSLPDPELYEGRSELELELVDPAVLSITRDQRAPWLAELEQAARADPAVISASSLISDGIASSARASSNGLRAARSRSWLWWGATVTVADGERRPEASRFCGGLHAADVPDRRRVAGEALARALERRGAEKGESLRTKLVTAPGAGPGLIGRVFGALSASAIHQERSFLADKRGQLVASPRLTIVDEPLLVRGMASRLYDQEGLATRTRDVFREGRLADFFVDTYYGKKLGWAPNGGSSSNLVFAHGTGGQAELIREAEAGFWVDTWLGGNANMTTGDFSFGFSGRRIVGGQLAQPVSEMNVTGNYLELFERLVAVGDDPEPWAVCRTPTLVFDDVQFSGR